MQQEDAHRSTPQQSGQPAHDRAGQCHAEPERDSQPDRHPERERAADKAQVAVGEQILGIASGVGDVLAAEHPADVRMVQPAQPLRATPAHGPCGTVRVAGMVGEAVVLAVRGDPVDQGALHRHRAQHGQQRSHRACGLEAAVGEQPVEAHRDAEPGERVGDREDIRSCQCGLPPHASHPPNASAAGGTAKKIHRATRSDVSSSIGTISAAAPRNALLSSRERHPRCPPPSPLRPQEQGAHSRLPLLQQLHANRQDNERAYTPDIRACLEANQGRPRGARRDIRRPP